MNRVPEEVIVAIDIGTTKICVLIARTMPDGTLELMGIGKAPSHGLARGVVVDIAPAVHSIKSACQEAEIMANYKIESAYIGISGSHIHAMNSHGLIAIKHGVISPQDVKNVIAAAQAVPIPDGQQILHVIPQFYTIDGHHRVLDPVGMHGVRLEAQVHLITGGVSSVQNLVSCCEMAGIGVRDIVLEPLASAEAVLSAEERSMGVAMLDIGGGTSDFAIYQQGTIRHTRIFTIAGNLFTQDLAVCLRTTMREAERLKRDFGILDHRLIEPDDFISVSTMHGEGTHDIPLNDVVAVIESRAVELLTMIHQEMHAYHLHQFAPAGLVLTGGGSLLDGLQESAHAILNIPVRLGKPTIDVSFKASLEHPMYATSYGLLLYALKKQARANLEQLTGPVVQRIYWRMKSWVFDFF